MSSSSDALAITRRGAAEDLQALAEAHFQHDLEPQDRDRLHLASKKLSLHTTVGTMLGIGLGAALAWKLRSIRIQTFKAFRMQEKPKSIKFENGREEPIPDLTPLVQPTLAGDIAAYLLFSTAGLFVGGETGLLTGSRAAQRTIKKDPASKERIERAWQGFRTDVLRRELALIEDKGKDKNDEKHGILSSLWKSH